MEKEELVLRASKHISDVLRDAVEYVSPHRALVVYDTEHGLTRVLTEAYRKALPDALFVDFNSIQKSEVLALFDTYQPRDLVVLIQSSNFRLDDFRIRLHLFSKKLKVIEHMHLYRNSEEIWDVYVNALAYDRTWYQQVGHGLKGILDKTNRLMLTASDCTLTFSGGLEDAKLNIGDYTGMENIGGTFPIGEVFTEAKDLWMTTGTCLVYAFAGSDFSVNMYPPFRVEFERGMLTKWADDAPQGFVEVIENIRASERAVLREIGFGLNRAITKERYMADITAFERIYGMHLSIGEKHSVYSKEGIQKHKTKFHVDIFPVVERVEADGKVIFSDGEYRVTEGVL